MTALTFKTSMDFKAKLITLSVILIFIATIISQFVMDGEPFFIVFFCLFLLVLLLPYLYSPYTYTCDDKVLSIKRPIGQIDVQLVDVLNVRELEDKELSPLFRLWGSGGFFGYFGKFSDARHRNFKMYCRRLDTRVMVFTKNGLLVLAPDNKEEFIKTIRKSLINK